MTLTVDLLKQMSDTILAAGRGFTRQADAADRAGKSMFTLGLAWCGVPGGEKAGCRVVVSPMALERTSERLFPVSKHRSARIHKKLVKRFGGEVRMKPAIFVAGQTIYVHPSLHKGLLAAPDWSSARAAIHGRRANFMILDDWSVA